MGQVRVERGGVRAVTHKVQQDQPMRWANHKANREAIYVGWLSASQNGNSCDCKCPACGEDLQAVNAGKDISHFLKANTRGMFFRHPSGHQRKDCSFLVAKLAALHLLMHSGEVDLPPPRRTGVHQGASGTTYTGETVGRAWRGRITDKVWVDSQSARITIDGLTVLVQLQARPNLSDDFVVDGEREDEVLSAAWQREDERQQWLDELSTERLIELLIPALTHHWLTDGPMSVDDEHEVLPQEIADRLTKLGFRDANDQVLLKKDGLLHCLDDIRNRHHSKRSVGRWSGLWRLTQESALQKYVTLVLIALKVYPLNLSPEDADRIHDLRRTVKESLDSEARTFARPTTYDEIIGRLFPQMRGALSNPLGTLEALQERVEERHALERRQAAEKERMEAEREAEIRYGLQLEQAQREKEQEEKSKRKQKIDDLLSNERVYAWRSDTSVSTIEPVLRQFNVIRLVRNYARSGMDVETLLRSAWASRNRGHPFRLWLSEQSVQDTAKAKMVLEVLRASGMIS